MFTKYFDYYSWFKYFTGYFCTHLCFTQLISRNFIEELKIVVKIGAEIFFYISFDLLYTLLLGAFMVTLMSYIKINYDALFTECQTYVWFLIRCWRTHNPSKFRVTIFNLCSFFMITFVNISTFFTVVIGIIFVIFVILYLLMCLIIVGIPLILGYSALSSRAQYFITRIRDLLLAVCYVIALGYYVLRNGWYDFNL